MSFANDVKDELAQVEPMCSHCLRATLAALVRVDGSLYLVGHGLHRLELDTDSLNTAKLIQSYLQQLYDIPVNLTIRQNVLHKSLNYLISIPPQDKLEKALIDLGVLTGEGGLELGIKTNMVEKHCCAAAYLRGAFIGTGFIAQPDSSAHFEISFSMEDVAQDCANLLMRKNIKAKIMRRRNSYVLYLKSGESITEFLAYTGAHRCALRLEEERVIKSVRNDANRKTNAEIANLQKTVDASSRTRRSIAKLQAKGRLESLPVALREIAYLRLQYPSLSLADLGQLATPPLSKSAVSHRIRRLEQIADSMKE